MPVRYAVANGDWSNTATWNDGATLGIPTGSDDVWANNFNVNINQSFSAISLNNSARSRVPATPQMTSNSTPGPFVIFASSTLGGSNEPWRAFDRGVTPATNVGWGAAAGQLTGSIGVDFGSGSSVVIDSYDIVGYNQVIYNPRTWAFQGSNDNIAWTNLHIVSGAAAIGASATYSIGSIGNTQGYRYYRFDITQNGGTAPLFLTELLLYERNSPIALAAGGSFIFNSGSISGSATSTTAALTAGATNLIQVTATTGSVTLNVSSSVSSFASVGAAVINHAGNCDFNLNGQNFVASTVDNAVCITKSSAGTITIRGNLQGGSGNTAPDAFRSSNGNTIVIGNVTAGAFGRGIAQSAGNVTVTGNVVGSTTGGSIHGISLTGAASQFTIIGNVTGGGASSTFGINHSGTSGSVIGNVTGGSGNSALGISTVGAVTVTGTVTGGTGNTSTHGINTSGVVTVTGNVIGSVGNGITPTNNLTVIGNVTGGSTGQGISSATNGISITVTGTATATATANAINLSGTGIANLTGNMINVSGRQAIYSQNLFISNTATSQWRLFTQGGQDKTLYSADTFPNQPSSANVRSGSLYGPANALSGSMVVPAPSDVRVGVLTDNTVGTGQSLTAADFLAAISSSADPFAQRLRNVATVDTVGSLVTGLNGGF